MADTVQEFFDSLADRADAEKTAGMNNSYLFDIEGAGQWLVAVNDGAVSVTEGGGDLGGDDDGGRARRAEPDHGLHDRQAEDQGRHGRGDEVAEAVLAL
jgi:hypothetical protein